MEHCIKGTAIACAAKAIFRHTKSTAKFRNLRIALFAPGGGVGLLAAGICRSLDAGVQQRLQAGNLGGRNAGQGVAAQFFDDDSPIHSHLQIRERRVVGIDDFPHFGDGGFQVALAEQARAGHKRVRAGARAFGGGLEIDAAVHADAIRQVSLAPPRLGLLDFRQGFVDEFLSAEAGIDGHHQQQVNLFEMRLHQRRWPWAG